MNTGKAMVNDKAINIYLREGIFQLNRPLEFNEQITGDKDYPITIQAYGKEKVSITGGYFRFINVLDEIAKPGDYYVDYENNVFYDILAGILISGRDIICNNNIFIDCDRPVIIQKHEVTEIHKQRQ